MQRPAPIVFPFLYGMLSMVYSLTGITYAADRMEMLTEIPMPRLMNRASVSRFRYGVLLMAVALVAIVALFVFTAWVYPIGMIAAGAVALAGFALVLSAVPERLREEKEMIAYARAHRIINQRQAERRHFRQLYLWPAAKGIRLAIRCWRLQLCRSIARNLERLADLIDEIDTRQAQRTG